MRQLDVTRFLSTVPFIDLVMALYGIQVWRGRFAGIGKKRLEDLNDVGQVTWRLLAGVPCLALGVCLLTPAMLMSHYNETSGNSAVKFTSGVLAWPLWTIAILSFVAALTTVLLRKPLLFIPPPLRRQ